MAPTDDTTTPDRGGSRSDRMRALERANEVRRARAQLKRQIADGELSAAEILLSPPVHANGLPLIELLMSQRRWGQAKYRRFVVEHRVDERKPIGALTDRQRRLLAEKLALAGAE